MEALRKGAYRQDAFRAAGIHPNTGWEWLRLGEHEPDAHPDYAELLLDVESAQAEFVLEMHELVLEQARSGAPQTWQAAVTLLERRYPEKYGRRDTTVVEGGESPLQVHTHELITDPEIRELQLELLRRLAGPGERRELPPT